MLTLIGKSIGAVTVFVTSMWLLATYSQPMPWSDSDKGIFTFFAVICSALLVAWIWIDETKIKPYEKMGD